MKLLLSASIILFWAFSCGSPDERASTGEDTLSIDKIEYEKTALALNDTKNQVLPQEGQASYYANRFHGRPTASGTAYDSTQYTAAHKTLPFGTKVKVTNLKNNKSVEVVINDRGPHHPRRIIDLSKAAARKLGFLDKGVTRVKVEKAQ